MRKKYYEVVLEGNIKTIRGMIEGFMLGRDERWEWYHSGDSGIETETLTEIIKEWITLKARFHHFILEENFVSSFSDLLGKRADLRYIKYKYIRSARLIRSCSFKFNADTHSKNYAAEIRSIIITPRDGVSIENFSIEEDDEGDESDSGLYPLEDVYEFWCRGIAVGSFGEIMNFRKTLEDHPLIKVNRVRLNLYSENLIPK